MLILDDVFIIVHLQLTLFFESVMFNTLPTEVHYVFMPFPLTVYSHHLILFPTFVLGCRSKYIVISKPLVHLTLNQCFRRYISELPLLQQPDSFHFSSTSATAYFLSRHMNRPGNPGSPLVIPTVSNVPATSLIGSLTNSSSISSFHLDSACF